MIVVNAKMETNEENFRVIKKAVEKVEIETRKEKGCIDYAFSVELHNDNNIRIWGECGQLIINDNNIEFYSLKNFEKFPAQNWHNIEMKNKNDHRAILIDNFGERIKSNKISNFNEDGIMSLAIVEAAYKSSVENRPISINEVL